MRSGLPVFSDKKIHCSARVWNVNNSSALVRVNGSIMTDRAKRVDTYTARYFLRILTSQKTRQFLQNLKLKS